MIFNFILKDTLVVDTNIPNVDAMFDAVMSTSPKNSQEDILMEAIGDKSDNMNFETHRHTSALEEG